VASVYVQTDVVQPVQTAGRGKPVPEMLYGAADAVDPELTQSGFTLQESPDHRRPHRESAERKNTRSGAIKLEGSCNPPSIDLNAQYWIRRYQSYNRKRRRKHQRMWLKRHRKNSGITRYRKDDVARHRRHQVPAVTSRLPVSRRGRSHCHGDEQGRMSQSCRS